MKLAFICLGVLCGLTACAPSEVRSTASESATNVSAEATDYDYVMMKNFNHEMAVFVGLTPGESFAESEIKINKVFKAYEGHAEPQNISMDASIVEAGWKQVVVTQDGLMDGTVTGQQLLAVFDENQKLVDYGMRIKCHSGSGTANWQNTVCE